MSKELRDKADMIMKELKDDLIPLKEELQSLRKSDRNNRTISQ